MSVCKYGLVDHGKERCTCAVAFAQAGVQPPPRLSDIGRMIRADHQSALDRQRAREMFVAAGKPVPEWCR